MLFGKGKKAVQDFFPHGYVDIHSHLLPGIDDGAKDLEQSLSLIRQMYAYGIKDIITTPHILGGVYPNTPEIIFEKLREVQYAIAEEGLDVRLRAAAEYMLDERFGELLKKRELLTLKDDYILVEMSFISPPDNLLKLLFDIQLAGYQPILAHPERYGFYHNNFKFYERLKELGCHFQLNLLSLTKQYGKIVQNTAFKLLKHGLIDFTGTDTHHEYHLELLAQIGTKKNMKLLSEVLERNREFVA